MHLGIELEITILDFPEWIARMIQGDFPHVAWSGSSAAYVDPMWFLDLFTTGNGYGTQWADRVYSALVARAKDSSDPDKAQRYAGGMREAAAPRDAGDANGPLGNCRPD